MNDADPAARSTGRELFMYLDQEYKSQAEMLYKVCFCIRSLHVCCLKIIWSLDLPLNITLAVLCKSVESTFNFWKREHAYHSRFTQTDIMT